MTRAKLLAAILDSIHDPVLFADTEHRIRYMNRAAVTHYEEGEALLGRSLFACHNEQSCQVIRETFESFLQGEDERLISDEPEQKIYMRVVRDEQGEVIGYYERYEKRNSD